MNKFLAVSVLTLVASSASAANDSKLKSAGIYKVDKTSAELLLAKSTNDHISISEDLYLIEEEKIKQIIKLIEEDTESISKKGE